MACLTWTPTLSFAPTLWPPLGHTTTGRKQVGHVDFLCLMELSNPKIPRETIEGLINFNEDSLAPDQHFTVLLWWSVDGRGEWRATPFVRDVGGRVWSIEHYEHKPRKHRFETFRLRLPYTDTRPLQFCLKYRFGDGPWLWSGSRVGGVDGRVVFVSTLEVEWPFNGVLEAPEGGGRDECLVVQALDAQQPWIERSSYKPNPSIKARYLIKASLGRLFRPDPAGQNGGEGAGGERAASSGVKDVLLGKPVRLERWMALVKIANPWMGPIHSQSAAAGGGGGATFATNKECLLLLMQRRDGHHVAILPLSGLPTKEGKATASSYITSESSVDGQGSVGRVFWRIYDESLKEDGCLGEAVCLVSVGMSSNAVLADVMEGAKQVVKAAMGPSEVAPTSISAAPGANPAAVSQQQAIKEPDFMTEALHSGLTYCTWNSLGAELSGLKILDALDELDKAGITVSNLIIDDNWQTLDNNKYTSSGTWTSTDANPNFRTVGGLKGLTRIIRERHPQIENIGVWHALHGYWDGITPGGAIDKVTGGTDAVWVDNVTREVRTLRFIPPERIGVFYDAFYKHLADCGITCVKVDVQCRINELRDGADRGRLLSAYQKALAFSVKKHFNSRAIFCMAHVPSILHCTLLGNDHIRPLFRTSDDFYPNIPESHGWHIFANAMNMIIFKYLNIIPDWDMFQTGLPQFAQFHAAARCLSGGPVIITDTPWNHNLKLIEEMLAPTPDGRSISLRPSELADACDPYISYTSSKLLRIRNRSVMEQRPGENGPVLVLTAFLLGFFNVSTVPIRDLFHLSDFAGLRSSCHYVTRSYRTGHVTAPVCPTQSPRSFYTLALGPGEWDIITLTPVFVVQNVLKKDEGEEMLHFGALGLSNNMTGVAAIVESGKNAKITVDRIRYDCMLKAVGTLVFYVSEAFPKVDFELCGLPLDKKYWRPHPEHMSVVEVFLEKALEEQEFLFNGCETFGVTLLVQRFKNEWGGGWRKEFSGMNVFDWVG